MRPPARKRSARVNMAAICGAIAGLALALASHAPHPAQVVVGIAACVAFIAALTQRPAAQADWLTVRFLLAGNLAVFAAGNAKEIGVVFTGLLFAAAAALVGAALVQSRRH